MRGVRADKYGSPITRSSWLVVASWRNTNWSARDWPRISGCVEWRMMPVASVTVSEPTPARPASADVRLGVHCAAAAAGPPMRALFSAIWRSEESAAANISRR